MTTLNRIEGLLQGRMTPKKWIEITQALDQLDEAALTTALARIDEAASSWPSSIDPHYFHAQLPPERLPKADPTMELRVCPAHWNKAVFEGEDSPKFSQIRVLMPRSADRIKGKHLMNLLELDHLDHVKYLRLDQVKPSAKFFKSMKKGHALSSLTHLRLWYTDAKGMSASTLKALCAASLPDLVHLDLGQNYIGPACGDVMGASKHLDGLRSLSLSNNKLEGAGVEALCGASFMSQLVSLDLGLNRMGDEAFARLLSAVSGSLEALVVEYNELGDSSARALATASHLTGLTSLDLRENAFSQDGLEDLVRAPHMQSLQELKVGKGFTEVLAKEMIDKNLLPNLTTLQANHRQEEACAAVDLLTEARPSLN